MIQEELENARIEQERIQTDLESAIERANAMAVEAEIANVELNQIINSSIDGLLLIYKDFSVKRINKSLLNFLGLSESEAAGKKCYDLIPCSWCNTHECPLTKLLRGKAYIELDIERTQKDGVTVPFMFAATPFCGLDGAVIGMVATFKDITERKYAENTLKEANERLERLTTLDGLTGVDNRRSFDQTIQKEWMRLQRTKDFLSLIMCDVDFFKLFNDTYGHQSGDDCLKSVARAMKGIARRGGDCVARYGGEEFAVILPVTGKKNAVFIAEKIRQTLEKKAIAHGKSSVAPFVTLSLGVATVIPDDQGTPELLIKCADDALYLAKSSGRNCVMVWEPPKEAPPQD
jgi:diguanylate cyclase (GGDEF)-like protein/PAS domain S-box-containing protein